MAGVPQDLPDESLLRMWSSLHGNEEEDLGSRVDQREEMFVQGDYWDRPNPFFLGPKKADGNYIGVKVIKRRYLHRYMERQIHAVVQNAKYIQNVHLCDYLGSITDNDREEVLIWQSHVPGTDLHSTLKMRRRGLDEMTARAYLRIVAEAVQILHENGIVLCKLRASKIVIDRDGLPILVDYVTPPSVYKPIYMRKHINVLAPEILSQQDYGRPSDVWSFGLLVFELLAGEPALEASEATQKLLQLPPPKSGDASESEDERPSTASTASAVAGLYRLTRRMEPEDFATSSVLSPEALEFALSCLHKLPEERPSLAELLSDPFLADPTVVKTVQRMRQMAFAKRQERIAVTVAMLNDDESDEEEEVEEEA